MNKPKTTSLFLLIAAVIFGSVSIFGQEPAASDRSYEATLHVVIGSDDTSPRGDLPKALDSVTKQIRDNFTFKSYRILNTYYGRLANGGSLEYKSVSSLTDGAVDLESPTFLDWTLGTFRAESGAAGKGSLSVQAFRFGARVPIVVSKLPGPDGKVAPITNYESVGLVLSKLGVSEGVPTLIGTISLPRTTGTVFLVMTIRSV